MKVIRFLAAAAMALTATTAMAQGGPPAGGAPGGQRGGGGTARLLVDITLTDAQKAKVDSIVTAARAESMKLREEATAGGGAPGPEVMQKMMAVTAKRNEAIKAVLTPEQAAQFDKNVAAIPPMGPPRPPR